MSAVFAHLLPSEESTHRCLAVIVASLGAIALIRGYRRHRRSTIIYMMTAGLILIAFGAFFGDHLPGHWEEVGITFAGSLLMIASHRLNHTFCANCACAEE